MSSTIPLVPTLATLVPTATATRIGHFIPTQPLSAEQVTISKAFYALLLVPGNVLIPILLVVAIYLRNSYSRSILFMNFWASWIGYCLGFLALFYTGDWDDVPDQPNFVLCEIQAIFVFITPVWTASTTVALIFQLWLSVVSLGRSTTLNAESGQSTFWNERTRTMALFWFPYIIFVIYAFGATMIAISRPELVGYDFLFCTVDFQPLRVAVSLYTAAVLLFGIGCQLDIGRRLYRERLAVKQVKVQGWPVISLFTRMMCFIVVSLSGVVASVLATRNNALKDERQIIQGVLPLVSFLIFGTNMGIYRRDRTSSGKSSISS